jgi:hypothetical protein
VWCRFAKLGMWDRKENVQEEIKSKCRTFSDLETDPISPKRLEEGLCTPGSYRRKMCIGTFLLRSLSCVVRVMRGHTEFDRRASSREKTKEVQSRRKLARNHEPWRYWKVDTAYVKLVHALHFRCAHGCRQSRT